MKAFFFVCAWHILGTVLGAPPNIQSVFLNSRNRWAKGTTFAFSTSPNFQNLTERWSTFEEPTYVAAISPATEADVVTTVKLAVKNHIPFLATGGRHGQGVTLGRLQNGLAIDLSQLDSVSVDKKKGTLTVGGGVQFGQVFGPVGDAGFHIQTGSGSCPGMMGASLGAGVGRYQGLYGFTLDALISARLVTAEGKLVEASSRSNPDLFWAIRGAGANFGIVTSATFKLNPQPNRGQVLNVDFILPASANTSYMDILASLDNMPPELATISFVMYNNTINELQILANWAYTGPRQEGLRLMEPVFRLNPVRYNVSVIPWKSLVGAAGFGADALFCAPGPGSPRSQYATNVRRLDAPTFKAMFQKMEVFYAKNPTARESVIELEIFSTKAAAAIPQDSTAYPWRDALGYAMFEFAWTDRAGRDACFALGEELRRDFAATSGYDDVAIYVNYARGDETIEQIYSKQKLPRLAAQKKKWDPNNVFRYSNPLPTHYP